MAAGRGVLLALLGVVAAAAGVLSFAALRDLAQVCGFSRWLGWLLPVVVDAGAAAGSLVWLGGRAGWSARSFARGLALALLGLSVVANALGHGLAAYRLVPPWWVLVIVSAIAPAVLGAVVHLAVLVGRPEPDTGSTIAAVDGAAEAEHGDVVSCPDPLANRAAVLIAAGAGRRRLARELGMSEHDARQLLDRARHHNPTSAAIGAAEAVRQGQAGQRSTARLDSGAWPGEAP
jgi:hypothetical protein